MWYYTIYKYIHILIHAGKEKHNCSVNFPLLQDDDMNSDSGLEIEDLKPSPIARKKIFSSTKYTGTYVL